MELLIVLAVVYVFTAAPWLIPSGLLTVLAVVGVLYFAFLALGLAGLGWAWLEEQRERLPWWARLPLVYAGAVLLVGGLGWLMGA